MKKIILALFVLFLLVVPVEAKKPSDTCATIKGGTILSSTGDAVTVGNDMWGYNYQAHMFNGFYDNYSRPTVPVNEGDWLQMKWNDAWLANTSCDTDNYLDRHYGYPGYPGSGAWLTNHMHGTYDGDWMVDGEWVLEFDYLDRLYFHDMVIEDNTFVGHGGYPAGGPYTTTWTVEGTVNSDNIEFTIHYDGSSYFVDAVGTIASDGTMSGTWGNNTQSGTWRSIEGAAYRDVCEWDYFVKIVTPNPVTYGTDYVAGGMWYNEAGEEIGPVIWGAFAIVQEIENDVCGGLEGLQYKSAVSPGLGYYKPGPLPVMEQSMCVHSTHRVAAMGCLLGEC